MRIATRNSQGGFAMDYFVDQFVERQNIAHYVKRLKTGSDPIKWAMLQKAIGRGKD